jgi:hypothetical protein
MLFRNFNNELIEINRKDFITDNEYYKYILSIKNLSYEKKLFDLQDKIKNIIINNK